MVHLLYRYQNIRSNLCIVPVLFHQLCLEMYQKGKFVLLLDNSHCLSVASHYNWNILYLEYSIFGIFYIWHTLFIFLGLFFLILKGFVGVKKWVKYVFSFSFSVGKLSLNMPYVFIYSFCMSSQCTRKILTRNHAY